MNEGPSRRSASRATQERLLAAATKLFLDLGYESTTVRSISTAASVTIGAFYGHFESKRTVLFEVVRAMNRPGRGGREPFATAGGRSLVLTVASFAHTDIDAATVLGEVLRGPGHDAAELDSKKAGDLLVQLAR